MTGSALLLGCIADDFTGAADLANNLVRGGMCTVQTIGVPSEQLPEAAGAAVVALKSRTIPDRDAVAQSLATLVSLRAQDCRQFLFKYCSTFDSNNGLTQVLFNAAPGNWAEGERGIASVPGREDEFKRAIGIGHIQVAGVPGRHEPNIGEINYPFLFELMDEIGYSGWVGCEYRPIKRMGGGLAWIRPCLIRD